MTGSRSSQSCGIRSPRSMSCSQPDATMLRHSAADNASLLNAYPEGFALDASHRPHITMLQSFVRTADLDKVYAAVGKVIARANVNAMKLEATKRYYLPAGELGVAGIVAKPTPQLLKLQADIIAAVSTIHGGNRPHRRVHSRARRTPPPTRPSSTTCPPSCRKSDGRDLQPPRHHRHRPDGRLWTGCSPSRLRHSRSRLRVWLSTNSARTARRRKNSRNGMGNPEPHSF